jgi:radical SAM superfamily enzyme YgiQ (UPF0313 family)
VGVPDPMPERLCLVIPPSPFLLDERVFMSLGILRVAAAMESQGHAIDLVDLSGVDDCTHAMAEYVRAADTRVYGITSTTPQLPSAYAIAREIRAHRLDARLIVGGPHVTLVNAARRREAQLGLAERATRALESLAGTFDVLVAGDGEHAMELAVRPDAPRLIDADDPRSPLFLTNARLNDLPFPARHLVDVDSYRYEIDGVRALSLIAQLGCPFGCGFCGGRESPTFRRVRTRSVASIIQEVALLHREYGVTGFMFYDDELNVSPKMVELMDALAELQRSIGERFHLRGFLKAELFDDRQAEALVRAGFRWILTGFESGSPRILSNINKHATVDDNTRCVRIAHRHGLKVKALMSLGHPGESDATVLETRDWLTAVRPDDLDVTLITPYPGTPYYDHAVHHPEREEVWVYTCPASGDRLCSFDVDYSRTAHYYKGDPDGGYEAYVYTDHLTCGDLVSARDGLERDLRRELGIPFPAKGPRIRYEHSMGQHGPTLPPRILRSSAAPDAAEPAPGGTITLRGSAMPPA